MKQRFSKVLALLLACAIAATQLMVPVFATGTTVCTCDEDTRTGVVVDSQAATCSEYGYDNMICDECSGTYIVLTTPPTGAHDYVDHAAQAPTCTEIGWDAYKT